MATKLYVRTTGDGLIVKGYSDLFMAPCDGDACIAEANHLIHFEIDGEVNPDLFDQNGIPLYKLVNNIPVRRTEEEIDAELSAMDNG